MASTFRLVHTDNILSDRRPMNHTFPFYTDIQHSGRTRVILKDRINSNNQPHQFRVFIVVSKPLICLFNAFKTFILTLAVLTSCYSTLQIYTVVLAAPPTLKQQHSKVLKVFSTPREQHCITSPGSASATTTLSRYHISARSFVRDLINYT